MGWLWEVSFLDLTELKNVFENVFREPLVLDEENLFWFYLDKKFQIFQDCMEKFFSGKVHPGTVVCGFYNKVLSFDKLAGGYILISCRGMGGIIINCLFCTDIHVQKFEDKKNFEKFEAYANDEIMAGGPTSS